MGRRVQETQLQYNAVFVGVFDLLHTKEDQLRAHRRHIASVAEYWLAQVDLEQLLLGSARQVSRQEGRQPGQEGGGGRLSPAARRAAEGRTVQAEQVDNEPESERQAWAEPRCTGTR